jgi:hypothetical protein
VSFDSESQRSLSALATVQILPVKEFPLSEWYRASPGNIAATLKERAATIGSPPREVEKVLQALDQGSEYPSLELLQYLLAPALSSFLEVLPSDARVFTLDAMRIERAAHELAESAEERAQRLLDEQHLIPLAREVYLEPIPRWISSRG